MKIVALIDVCTYCDEVIIEKVIENTLGTKPTIIDEQDGGWDFKEDLIITFGKEAYEAQISLGKKPIGLPHPDRLTDTKENQDAREYAWRTLSELKKYLDSKQNDVQSRLLSKESLPSVTADKVVELEKNNPNGWIGKTINGRTIRISKQPEDGNEDIRITYAELYALKVAVELLGVKEFELVPSNKTNPSRNS